MIQTIAALQQSHTALSPLGASAYVFGYLDIEVKGLDAVSPAHPHRRSHTQPTGAVGK
jgi:hypothetical protein